MDNWRTFPSWKRLHRLQQQNKRIPALEAEREGYRLRCERVERENERLRELASLGYDLSTHAASGILACKSNTPNWDAAMLERIGQYQRAADALRGESEGQ